MAIGNPFQLGHTVTVGVVSFERRPFELTDGYWEEMIQTDVAINPGSSGGPLLNLSGEVIGINVAVLDSIDRSSTGIGFAIPINSVKAVLPRLRQGGVARGRLGAQFHRGPILDDEAMVLGLPRAAGALVKSIDRASTAARAGLRPGDVVVAIDGWPIGQTRDLIARTTATAPGTWVTLEIVRDGQRQFRTVGIERWPLDYGTEPPPTAAAGRNHGLTLAPVLPGPSPRSKLPYGLDGALIVNIQVGSAADEGELRAGDVIRQVNGHRIHSADEATRELTRLETQPVFLLVWREGRELLLEMRRR
jgi:serine protease Do